MSSEKTNTVMPIFYEGFDQWTYTNETKGIHIVFTYWTDCEMLEIKIFQDNDGYSPIILIELFSKGYSDFFLRETPESRRIIRSWCNFIVDNVEPDKLNYDYERIQPSKRISIEVLRSWKYAKMSRYHCGLGLSGGFRKKMFGHIAPINNPLRRKLKY